ncbi:hypothetical protein FOCG_02967 [Fusarium oxysporum f. sp. radicis-lycopersici 26381]|uniref:Uncharacterized protein n=4 Tax=Fusarium oxysporum TaxID=5507 RepID=W9IPD0_FUSOX|nr:hypothetical protein FOXG_19806 [Fusarium oxysporum f. sp. lycopersici 4287]EWY96502.1 hypothetical protein FOYG_05183 [Fusarium oxysporum NRRL 32931]EWZ41665.1 hypothetical protein FOZG_06877 [Fusarium oxysporum Fo47]EXA01238.1 hypothetical protein FOWG_01169 [Fusarium oxysporum f. sp. lycopersici MN25]EXK31918.1 hypothetical protein FOMG_12302 [Fusarium oxysporum f. sp. melonis 26406]EXL59919.1 hypothetical protein FOCG_02967 [Fusarium oxysporum f. sp. radicis-lycopersici 26381]
MERTVHLLEKKFAEKGQEGSWIHGSCIAVDNSEWSFCEALCDSGMLAEVAFI